MRTRMTCCIIGLALACTMGCDIEMAENARSLSGIADGAIGINDLDQVVLVPDANGFMRAPNSVGPEVDVSQIGSLE